MFTYLYEHYLDSKVIAADFVDRGVIMINISDMKFKKSSLNDVVVMIDSQLRNSIHTFSDSQLFIDEIYQNESRLDAFISQMSKIDETRKVEKNKVKALLNSYEILLKNAVAKVDSEMFYDVIYTMLYEVPSIIIEVSDISIQQSAVKCNENDLRNQRIQIRNPLEKGFFDFLITCGTISL